MSQGEPKRTQQEDLLRDSVFSVVAVIFRNPLEPKDTLSVVDLLMTTTPTTETKHSGSSKDYISTKEGRKGPKAEKQLACSEDNQAQHRDREVVLDKR